MRRGLACLGGAAAIARASRALNGATRRPSRNAISAVCWTAPSVSPVQPPRRRPSQADSSSDEAVAARRAPVATGSGSNATEPAMATKPPIMTRTGSGRPAAAASPAALALGWSSITTRISARDAMPAATRASVTCAGSHIGARTMRRASTETISARAPKLPIRLSAMISKARSRSPPAPRPSAVSARPSSCSAPVTRIIATIASSADGNDGRPDQRPWRRRARPAGPRRRRPAGRRRPRRRDPAWSPCRRGGRGTGSGTVGRP